jgi:hypothetical protein
MNDEAHESHGWLRPIDARLVLALLGSVGLFGGAYVHTSHESDAMTTQQAQQIGGMRTLIEQADQRCNELRIKDLRDDMRQHDAH